MATAAIIIIIPTFEQRGKNNVVIVSPSIQRGRGLWLHLGLKFTLNCLRVRKLQTKEMKWKEWSFPSRSREATAMYE